MPSGVEALLGEHIGGLGDVSKNGVAALDFWHSFADLHETIVDRLQTSDRLRDNATKHDKLELRVIEAAVFVANAWFLHDNEYTIDVLNETAEVNAILNEVVVLALPFILTLVEFNELSEAVVLDFEAGWQFDTQRETNKVAFVKDRVWQLNAENVRNRVRVRWQWSHLAQWNIESVNASSLFLSLKDASWHHDGGEEIVKVTIGDADDIVEQRVLTNRNAVQVARERHRSVIRRWVSAILIECLAFVTIVADVFLWTATLIALNL